MKKILVILLLLVSLLVSCNKTYYITFYVEDDIYHQIVVDSDFEFVLPENPIKEEYVFEGWYLGDNKIETINNVKENINLIAKFRELIYFNLKFVIDDSVYYEFSVAENESIPSVDNPTKPYMIFEGWYLDGTQFDMNSFLTKDTVLEARFKDDGVHRMHNFSDSRCVICGSAYNELLFELYGSDSVIYTNDMENPYGIDLSIYGRDVNVLFYEGEDFTDPYLNVNKKEFYQNYTEASSYLDAKYRTEHGLMSGDITPQTHLPAENSNSNIKCTTATYVLDTNGEYIAYVINNLTGSDDIIYYGGAYTSLNEVAAYLLAFGVVPPNSNYDKGSSGRRQSVSFWGEYGRCNTGEFYGNTGSYPYEPPLPMNDTLLYRETDFGTLGGYSNISPSKTYNQTIYNNGNSITRGSARFCFIAEKSKNIDNRYVFYTYNHYNDFQEYLNYYNGFGKRFGNESAGNTYCANSNDFYNYCEFSITKYPIPLRYTKKQLISK